MLICVLKQSKAVELLALLSMPPRVLAAVGFPSESPMQIRSILANNGALALFVEHRENVDPDIRKYDHSSIFFTIFLCDATTEITFLTDGLWRALSVFFKIIRSGAGTQFWHNGCFASLSLDLPRKCGRPLAA